MPGLGGDVGGLGDGSVGALTKLLLVHLVVVLQRCRRLKSFGRVGGGKRFGLEFRDFAVLSFQRFKRV